MENQQQIYYLGRRTFWLFMIERLIITFFFLIVAAVIFWLKLSFVDSIPSWIFPTINWAILAFLLLAIVVLILGIAIVFLQYKTSKMIFNDASFCISRGVFSREEVVIPYRRVQSVQIKQPFFYRILGLGHLVIATTTDLERPSEIESETNEEVIPTIDYPLAKIIEKILTSRAEVERVENVQSQRN